MLWLILSEVYQKVRLFVKCHYIYLEDFEIFALWFVFGWNIVDLYIEQ